MLASLISRQTPIDMLLGEAIVDPLLEGYKVITLDEAHKQPLALDVLFVLLKEVMRYRALAKELVIRNKP